MPVGKNRECHIAVLSEHFKNVLPQERLPAAEDVCGPSLPDPEAGAAHAPLSPFEDH